MNYMELISRSFQNAWRYKFLWFFGFMVAAAELGEVMIQDDEKSGDWSQQLAQWGIDPALFVALGLILLTSWVFFWILSVLSEGALIQGIVRKERGLETGFGDCWSAGVNKFLRLFGIMLLAVLILVSFVFSLIAVVAPSFILAKPVGVLLLLVALPTLFAAIVVVLCVEGWAIRYAVVYDLPWRSAIQQGWRLFRQNVGPSLAVAVSSILAQIVFFCAVLFCIAVMSLPFILLGLGTDQAVLWPGLVAIGVVIVLFLAMVGTFASSYWTLAYLRLTGGSGPNPL